MQIFSMHEQREKGEDNFQIGFQHTTDFFETKAIQQFDVKSL